MLGTVLATASAAVLAAPVAGLAVHRQVKRAAHARRLRITGPRGIDESGFVRIGGIDQWVSVRGEDRRNPVLLEIHGGPGASNLPYAHRTRSWEQHFTLVRWDMRGAGKTFARTGPTGQGELTLERLEADALEVTHHVRARLGVDKVVLLASSFGTVTGLRLARRHPELYAAYVGTDQNIVDGGRDRTAHDALVDRLTRAGRRKDLAAVTAMGADRSAWTAHQWSRNNKLVVGSDPLTLDTVKKVVLGSMLTSPLLTLREVRSFMKAMEFCEPLGPQAIATVDERAEGTDFALPFFVFQGARDVITPVAPARRFFDQVSAPVKAFALIEGAGHFASFRHPDRFLDLLLTKVRPALAEAAEAR
ncbi:alpha/beta fold hydrolase [Streptomyces sp. NRRL S-87]|uniref:alpha/beta fold hydrolase n=1 Tax=Streptomyces sp. NRRL S-87 TaxID=1463920 RepID=UPI0004C20A64|nr:alpha/beta hydrolase [Streptomyces sp. NRRL S-87]